MIKYMFLIWITDEGHSKVEWDHDRFPAVDLKIPKN